MRKVQVPLVTVAIPTRNSAKTIVSSIVSALRQNHGNIEVLVADDHSEDDTVERVLQIKDSRIRVLHNSNPLGLVASRNQLLREASGSYVAWQDSDDISSPSRVTRQLQFMQRNPQIEICGAWFTKIPAHTSSKSPTTTSARAKIEICRLPNDLEYIRVGQLFGNLQPMSVLMMTRVLCDGRIRQLDARYETAEDCQAVSMSIAAGTFGFVDALVVQETKSISGINASHGHRQSQVLKSIMNEYATKLGFSNTTYDSTTAHYLASATGESLDLDSIRELKRWCLLLVNQNRNQKLVADSILRWWLILLWQRFLRENKISLYSTQLLRVNSFALRPPWTLAIARAALWKTKTSGQSE